MYNDSDVGLFEVHKHFIEISLKINIPECK